MMHLESLSHVRILKGEIYKNGKLIFSDPERDFSAFAKKAYANLKIDYLKFFRMDDLSKLCFLAAEHLLSEVNLPEWDGSKVSIVVASRTGSLETDKKHVESFKDRQNYFPGPAVFVYTLPNIMLGEMCIRHQITGETNCFMMNQFDEEFILNYANELINRQKQEFCIAGWVNFDSKDYEANLTLLRAGSPSAEPNVFAIFDPK